MDAGRLLEVLEDIDAEFSGSYIKTLQSIVQSYTAARDTPAQDPSGQIKTAHERLAEFFKSSVFTDYPPSKRHILDAIGGSRLVGPEAEVYFLGLLVDAGMSAASVVAVATEFVTKVDKFRKSCSQALTGLRALGVVPHSLGASECEVGVLIPRGISGGNLSGLNGELAQWNLALKGFAELAGEEQREIAVKGLASGSDEAYLAVGIVTARLLALAIDRVLAWYKKIMEIQEARARLASLGAPVAEAAAVKAHEKKLLEDGISSLVHDLIEQSGTKLAANRKGEIENQLTITVRHIAKFVDHGGDVEVTVGVPEYPEDLVPPDASADSEEARKAQKEYLEERKNRARLLEEISTAESISRQGSKLRELPPRQRPILQIGEADEDKGRKK
jgi:hypothetical protein